MAGIGVKEEHVGPLPYVLRGVVGEGEGAVATLSGPTSYGDQEDGDLSVDWGDGAVAGGRFRGPAEVPPDALSHRYAAAGVHLVRRREHAVWGDKWVSHWSNLSSEIHVPGPGLAVAPFVSVEGLRVGALSSRRPGRLVSAQVGVRAGRPVEVRAALLDARGRTLLERPVVEGAVTGLWTPFHARTDGPERPARIVVALAGAGEVVATAEAAA